MKYLTAMLLIFSLSLPVLAEEENKQPVNDKNPPESFYPFNAGISIIPYTHWYFYQDWQKNLKYEFDQTRSTVYETNFRMGIFSFGATALVNDNIIGKVDTLLGYIGISLVSLKISDSHIRGTGHWSGEMALDMKREFKFDDKVRSYDLVYNWGENIMEGLKSFYAGITYTKLTVPMGIDASPRPPTGYLLTGKPVYDEKFSLKSVGIVFGFDMLKDKSRNPGLDIFGVSQDRFNLYNEYSFSKAAVARVRALNPGYQPNNTGGKDFYPFGSGYLDNETAVGLCWTHNFTGGHIIFAIGYDLIWGLVAGPSYETPARNTMALTGDSALFFRHGIVFRVYASW